MRLYCRCIIQSKCNMLCWVYSIMCIGNVFFFTSIYQVKFRRNVKNQSFPNFFKNHRYSFHLRNVAKNDLQLKSVSQMRESRLVFRMVCWKKNGYALIVTNEILHFLRFWDRCKMLKYVLISATSVIYLNRFISKSVHGMYFFSNIYIMWNSKEMLKIIVFEIFCKIIDIVFVLETWQRVGFQVKPVPQ